MNCWLATDSRQALQQCRANAAAVALAIVVDATSAFKDYNGKQDC